MGEARAGGFLVAALLVYACQRVQRASGLNFVFAHVPLKFPGPGGGVYDGSLPSTEMLSVYSCHLFERANRVIFVLVRFHC